MTGARSGDQAADDDSASGRRDSADDASKDSSNRDAKDSQQWRPKSNPWLIAVVVTLAAFMEVLDSTIVNVALPHISGSMSSSYDEATWTLTSYLVANGIVLPLSAFFSRWLGRKRYFVLCIAAFTVCSLLCGLSTQLWQLILFRILQGFFGGGLQPIQQSVILDTFEPSQRGKAFAVSAVAIVVAPVLGPTLGGLITDNFSWRWVFLINVPIGILTVIAVMQFVEDPPWERRAKKGSLSVDYIGIGLIAIGLGCLQVMLDRGEDDDWFGSGFIITFAALAVVGLVGATFWLLYAKKPVVNIRVLKDRNFAIGSTVIAGFAMILYGSSVLIPQLAQQQLGYTATLAGLVLSPGAIAVTLIIPLISRAMPYVEARYIVATGFFLLGCAMLYCTRLIPDIDYTTLVLMRSSQSAAIAFLFVPVTTLAYLSLPKQLNGDASALFTMFRNVAGSIGISLSTALVTERTQVQMAHANEHMSPFSANYQNTLQQIQLTLESAGQTAAQAAQQASGYMYQTFIKQSTILAYIDIFSFCAIFAFCFVPLSFFFSSSKPSGESGGH